MNALEALNKLGKWRMALAGRWLGTRSDRDPECIAVRDVIDKLLVLRVEVSALSRVLIEQRVLDARSYQDAIATEALALDKLYEQAFPGLSTSATAVAVNASGHCGLHRTTPGPRRCIERDGFAAIWARGTVRLTVAHLNALGGPCQCQPLCALGAHVLALCNRCHLRYDVKLHVRNAWLGRRRNNLELFPTPGGVTHG